MRIVTRSDFDSLISAVLLTCVHEIDEIMITNQDRVLQR